jgi:hypothetical protein
MFLCIGFAKNIITQIVLHIKNIFYVPFPSLGAALSLARLPREILPYWQDKMKKQITPFQSLPSRGARFSPANVFSPSSPFICFSPFAYRFFSVHPNISQEIYKGKMNGLRRPCKFPG